MPHRTIAIGDIHGCSRALATLLDAIQPRSDDVIVPLGDVIDRGPDSRGVIERLIALSSTCQVVPILGNHDQVLLDIHHGKHPLDWLLAMGGGPTLESYGTGRDLANIPPAHFAFLETFRDFYQTDTHIFTHANYLFYLPMSEQPDSILRWEALGKGGLIPEPHDSGKTVIVGHTAQTSGEILDLGHVVGIDTFCHGGKWLTALEVRTGEIWQASQRGKIRYG